MVAGVCLGHHIGGDQTVFGYQVGYSGELAAVSYRVTEKPLHLAVIHRKITGIDDTLEKKIGFLKLVIEEDVVLGELKGSEVVLFNHLGTKHVHPGKQPAASAGLLVGDTLGLHLVRKVVVVGGLNALLHGELVDVIGRNGILQGQFLGRSLPALTDPVHHLVSDTALSHGGGCY